MASVLDVFLRAVLDDKDLEKQAIASGSKAGDTAGKAMGSRLSAGIAIGVKALALGAGAMFGVATKGAVDLQNAQAKFTAETGLTGDAADKTAQKILDWSTATGQDAVEATKSWDDTLDSWHMTADQLPGLMDQLIAGTQKYGGTVSGAEAAVVALAPAIQGLGGDFNDATGFVNLFETAGLDASAAAKGLQTALKSLKPGQSLNDLIKQVASIVDPTQRAQEAMHIFGTRSGAGLANALQPGITSLDQFVVSTGDAAGATQKAADAIKGTFSNQIQLVLHNVSGALAELGAQFGPAVTGFASLASLLAPTLATVFGKLGGSGLVQGAATAAGVVLGPIFAAALFAGEELAAAALRGLAAIGISTSVLGAATGSGRAIGAAVLAGISQTAPWLLAYLAGQAIANEAVKPFNIPQFDPNTGGFTKPNSTQFQQNQAYGHDLGTEAGKAWAKAWYDAINAGQTDAQAQVTADRAIANLAPAITQAAGTVGTAEADQFRKSGEAAGQANARAIAYAYAGQLPDSIADIMNRNKIAAAEQTAQWIATGTAIGQSIPASIAQGALSADSVLSDGIKALRDLIKNGLSPKQLAAQALGHRFGVDLARGFESSKIGAVDTARSLAVDSIAAIEKAGLKGPRAADKVAKMVGELYASGLNAKEIVAAVKAAGGNLNEDAVNKMLGKTGPGSPPYRGGQAVANSWLDGLISAVRAGGSAHSGFANALGEIKSLLFGNSPPARGPLKDIDKGGFNVGRSWHDRFLAGLGITEADVRGALGFSMPAFAGATIGVDVGQGLVRHEHSGTVKVDLSEQSWRAARSAGMSNADIGEVLAAANRTAHLTSTAPRRS